MTRIYASFYLNYTSFNKYTARQRARNIASVGQRLKKIFIISNQVNLLITAQGRNHKVHQKIFYGVKGQIRSNSSIRATLL